MTEPTDDEIVALADATRTAEGGANGYILPISFARAVLEKWGTPPAVAGEPVAWMGTYDKTDLYYRKPPQADVVPLYATPQPTQAQAGAVPLTCEWAHNEDDGFWDTECGQSWRFDYGGPKENHMNFCHCCGKPLRIKGGQHGTE